MASQDERAALTHPPVEIMDVADAALAALAKDARFRKCPGGKLEIAWRQPSKARDGWDARPARYCLTVEFLFTESAS